MFLSTSTIHSSSLSIHAHRCHTFYFSSFWLLRAATAACCEFGLMVQSFSISIVGPTMLSLCQSSDWTEDVIIPETTTEKRKQQQQQQKLLSLLSLKQSTQWISIAYAPCVDVLCRWRRCCIGCAQIWRILAKSPSFAYTHRHTHTQENIGVSFSSYKFFNRFASQSSPIPNFE